MMPTEPGQNVEIEPLKVTVENFKSEKEAAADWGSWQTFLTPAGPAVPQQILPQNNKRKQAGIYVSGAAGYVLVGTRGQIMNGQGGRLIAGSSNRFPIENKQELWMTGDGTNACTVTVLDERYE